VTFSDKSAGSRVFWFSLLVCSLWMAWPLWVTRYLPIEDLPQHLAAIRVLHDYHNPRFAFERYFELTLFRTQYLAYYVVVDALAYVLPLELANRCVLLLCACATPLSIAYLLGALGRPRWPALFALPLTYNAQLILGFSNFLMAVPALFFGLGLCALNSQKRSALREVALVSAALFGFLCHVVPFGFLVLGAVLLAYRWPVSVAAKRLWPLLPALCAALWWLVHSPAGVATRAAVHAAPLDTHRLAPHYRAFEVAWRELPAWLTDVLRDPYALRQLAAWVALFGAALVWGSARALVQAHSSKAAGSGVLHEEPSLTSDSTCASSAAVRRERAVHAGDEPEAQAALIRREGVTRERAARAAVDNLWLRLIPLAPLAALGYFVLPDGYDWIWPIAPRFAWLALLLAIPLTPCLPRYGTWLFALLLLGLSARAQAIASRNFAAFDTQEVESFDAALAAIPEGRRVVGLIFARGSQYVRFAPFLHYAAYYQARKGGAVMFSFADFPQSPFRFRAHDRPPAVPARWEWQPQRVRAKDLAWYDYALTRGGSAPCSGRCELLFRSGVWEVWKLKASGDRTELSDR